MVAPLFLQACFQSYPKCIPQYRSPEHVDSLHLGQCCPHVYLGLLSTLPRSNAVSECIRWCSSLPASQLQHPPPAGSSLQKYVELCSCDPPVPSIATLPSVGVDVRPPNLSLCWFIRHDRQDERLHFLGQTLSSPNLHGQANQSYYVLPVHMVSFVLRSTPERSLPRSYSAHGVINTTIPCRGAIILTHLVAPNIHTSLYTASFCLRVTVMTFSRHQLGRLLLFDTSIATYRNLNS